MSFLHPKNLFKVFIIILATGALFSALSEFWFYPVPLTFEATLIVAFYGLIGYFFVLCLSHFNAHNFYAMFLAAAVFGFLIEGVPVTVLFLGLPFSIAWTSLGWHALITICIGWYGYRIWMSHIHWWPAALSNILFGAGLGLWNGYLWNAAEDNSQLDWQWVSPWEFSLQFLAGYGLFVFGHMGLDWLSSRWPTPKPAEFKSVLVIITVLFALGSLIAAFPFSLVIFPLVGACLWALERGRKDTPGQIPTILHTAIAWHRYVFSLLIPAFACLVYWVIFTTEFKFETNALLAVTAIPISVYLLLVGLYRGARKTLGGTGP